MDGGSVRAEGVVAELGVEGRGAAAADEVGGVGIGGDCRRREGGGEDEKEGEEKGRGCHTIA